MHHVWYIPGIHEIRRLIYIIGNRVSHRFSLQPTQCCRRYEQNTWESISKIPSMQVFLLGVLLGSPPANKHMDSPPGVGSSLDTNGFT